MQNWLLISNWYDDALEIFKVKGSAVKCSVGKGWKRRVMGRIYMGSKVVKIEGLGYKRVCNMVGNNIRNYIQYFLCFHYVNLFKPYLSCLYCCNLMCICLSHLYLLCLMCICYILCVFVVSYVCLLYFYVYLLYLCVLVVLLCVFVVLCQYWYSYFRCQTAG